MQKQIKMIFWIERFPEEETELKDGKEIKHRKIVEKEANTTSMLSNLINSCIGDSDDKHLEKGMDGFRFMHRITAQFEKAVQYSEKDKENCYLYLDSGDYAKLSDIVKTKIPKQWGANKNIFDAIEAFLNPDQTDDK